jgi:hypothetical protein
MPRFGGGYGLMERIVFILLFPLEKNFRENPLFPLLRVVRHNRRHLIPLTPPKIFELKVVRH